MYVLYGKVCVCGTVCYNYFSEVFCFKAIITQWWTLVKICHKILTVTGIHVVRPCSTDLACLRISWQFKVRLNVVERWMCIHNQYLYTPSIHQMAYESRLNYHEILMHLVSFHDSVHNDRIPNLIKNKISF